MRRLLFTLTAFLLLSTPAQASWSWPVRGDVITPYRNGADPYAGGQHRGIDIAAAVGTAVVAAAGGEVRFAGTAGSSGLTVSVRTGDGFDTSYLHLSALAVRAGARVSAGERLGAAGTTGTRSADPPHLHFGVREAGTRHVYIDPLSMLPPAAAPPPGAAPQPAPAPAPVAPRAAPAPRPAPAPRGVPRRAPRGAPRPAPVPRGAPRPAPGPRSAPAPRPAARSAPAPAPAPLGAPGPAPTLRAEPRRAPAPSPLPAPLGARAFSLLDAPRLASAPHQRPSPARAASTAEAHSAPPSSGPDIGWALACAGLLLAAGFLGLSGDRRDASGRGQARLARNASRLAGALRPLLGRR
ncbi:MAG: M23 family metallopeptidase [Thermoleophilaceae bacterium]